MPFASFRQWQNGVQFLRKGNTHISINCPASICCDAVWSTRHFSVVAWYTFVVRCHHRRRQSTSRVSQLMTTITKANSRLHNEISSYRISYCTICVCVSYSRVYLNRSVSYDAFVEWNVVDVVVCLWSMYAPGSHAFAFVTYVNRRHNTLCACHRRRGR